MPCHLLFPSRALFTVRTPASSGRAGVPPRRATLLALPALAQSSARAERSSAHAVRAPCGMTVWLY
jgi:hypothetical protein